ncbi:hypothetical protein NO2_1495, partial [Candidatus Termititenax persephonae]
MLRRYIYIFIAALLFAGAGAAVVPEWSAPSQPSASWQTSAANSGDTQTIHIDRPDMTDVPTTVNYWQIKYKHSSDSSDTQVNVPANTATYLINNIKDNGIVTINVRWSSDSSGTNTSDWSPTTIVSIGDKTAPTISNHSVAGSPNIIPNAKITIFGSDEGSGINWTNSRITINGVLGSLTTSGTYIPSGQKYGTTYSVSVNLSDSSGNYMTTPYTFSYTTKPIPTPSVPIVSWTNQGINNNQEITVGKPGTAADTEYNVTKWEVQWKYSTDTDWGGATTLNISNASHIISSVKDNCTINVRVRWVRDDGQTSAWVTNNISLGDKTAPTISNHSVAGSPNINPNAQITISGSDEGSGINWTNSKITINGILGTLTGNGGNGEYEPSFQTYNTTYNVSVTLYDVSGNTSTPYTFAYKTTMNTPPAPTVVWNPEVINSRDTQKFTVTRPITDNIENITHWDIRWRYDGGNWATIQACSISSSSLQYSNISDNCTIEVQVRYREGNLASDWSATTSLTIGDRTPPRVTSHDISGTPNNINPASSKIEIHGNDEDGGIDWASSIITVDGISKSFFNYSANVGDIDMSDQKYNTTYNVSIVLYDNAGNFMTTPYTFSYKTTINAEFTPDVTWNPQAVNSGDAQKFTVKKPTIAKVENITEWDMRWKYSGEDDTQWRTTTNIAINTDSQTIQDVSDNCLINVEVRYRINASISKWYSATLTIGDRTPPQVTDYNISGAPNDIEPNTEIVISGSDEGGGITWMDSEITINNTHVFLNSSTYTPTGQKYGITYNVAVVLSDSAGNYMDSPYVFEYKTKDIPLPNFDVQWNDQGLNSADSQKITVTRPSTTNLHTSITSWNMQWKYSTDTDWQSITLNI